MTENANFAVNDYGITIEKKCVSCQYCENCGIIKGNQTHKCKKHERTTKASDKCEYWMLRKGLYVAGKGGGRIKRRAYIEYLSDVRVKEGSRDAAQTSIEELRRQFKATAHTDVYQ